MIGVRGRKGYTREPGSRDKNTPKDVIFFGTIRHLSYEVFRIYSFKAVYVYLQYEADEVRLKRDNSTYPRGT